MMADVSCGSVCSGRRVDDRRDPVNFNRDLGCGSHPESDAIVYVKESNPVKSGWG